MQQPLVSVIIPAFNASATLARTLASAAGQTYRRIEIIIVDDGSTDDTADIARDFCSNESRAAYIHQANAGVSAARNTGIKAAQGEWFAPLDADDVWHKSKIERQVATALSAPAMPGFVYCWFHLIDEADQVIGSSEAYEVRGQVVDCLLYFNFVGNGSSPLVRRDAALAAGGYDSRLSKGGFGGCEDLAFQLRIARDWPVEVVPQYLLGYRDTEGSMSENWQRMHRSWRRALELFEAEGGHLNKQCIRRNGAYRALRLAERLSRRGARVDAAREIARAIRLDPARSTAKLFYRFARSARRRIAGARADLPALYYVDAPIDSPVRRDPDEIALFASALSRWDRRRMAALLRAGNQAPQRAADPTRSYAATVGASN